MHYTETLLDDETSLKQTIYQNAWEDLNDEDDDELDDEEFDIDEEDYEELDFDEMDIDDDDDFEDFDDDDLDDDDWPYSRKPPECRAGQSTISRESSRFFWVELVFMPGK